MDFTTLDPVRHQIRKLSYAEQKELVRELNKASKEKATFLESLQFVTNRLQQWGLVVENLGFPAEVDAFLASPQKPLVLLLSETYESGNRHRVILIIIIKKTNNYPY